MSLSSIANPAWETIRGVSFSMLHGPTLVTIVVTLGTGPADCGGSNGARVRVWKVELQKLADETGLVLHVHHLSARNIEVEQDRAPPVLPHHPELAWTTVDRSRRLWHL